jgi:regulator of sigma E protease
VAVNDHKITDTAQLINFTKDKRGQTVAVEYQRGDVKKTVDVTLRDASSAVLGVELGQQMVTRSTWSAPIVGVVTTLQFSWVTLVGVIEVVWKLLAGLVLLAIPVAHQVSSADLSYVSGSVAGPVGIVGEIFPAAAKAGPTELALLSAIISLTLAVMNILPIPALDGGRWFVSALFRIRKKVLTKEKEERITMVGFSVLMLLIVVITVGDVAKLF